MSKLGHSIGRIFMSRDERLEEDEINRDVKVRMGKSRLNRHIAHQRQMEVKLTDLARKALALNDNDRFKQIARQLLWTRADITRWEKYVLSMEVLETRREQAKASVELLKSVKAMSESMIDLAGPQQAADLQRQLQEGMARAEGLDERLSVMMDMMDSTLQEGTPDDETQIGDIEKNLTDQIAQSETASYDKDIEEGLRKVREELKSQDKK